MKVQERIKKYPACEAIDLTEGEKDIYSGAGWKLARFVDGNLVEFFDPTEVKYREDAQEMTDEAIKNALAWLANAKGEVWLVLCSCYQLCEPRRITLTDAGALAHLARVIGEKLTGE